MSPSFLLSSALVFFARLLPKLMKSLNFLGSLALDIIFVLLSFLPLAELLTDSETVSLPVLTVTLQVALKLLRHSCALRTLVFSTVKQVWHGPRGLIPAMVARPHTGYFGLNGRIADLLGTVWS